MPLVEGQTICNGKYQILHLIGEGGQSRVWLAREAARDLEVAIKEPLAGLSAVEQQELERRFHREIRLSAEFLKLDAPNIVRAWTVDEHEGLPLLVMEFCAGGSLADKLKKGPLPVDEAVRIIVAVCRALELPHTELGLVHRDIKPSNILFTSSGAVRLSDFGLAQTRESGRSLLTGGRHPGTPGYMCPEQEETTGYLTPGCDLYALGCVLFEMLTGRLYQDCPPGTPAGAYRREVPTSVDRVLAKVLQGDEWQRFDSAAELAAALQQATAQSSGGMDQFAERLRGAVGSVPPWAWALVVIVALVVLWSVRSRLPALPPSGRSTPTPTATATVLVTASVPAPTPTVPPKRTSTPSATRTASVTPTRRDTPTATQTPTASATATETRTLTPTPTPTLEPAPELDSPAQGAQVGGEVVTSRWRWVRPLGENEYFDVRAWQEGEAEEGIAWARDMQYEARHLCSGRYSWRIVVLRHTATRLDGSKEWVQVSEESEVRWFTNSPPYPPPC